MNAITHDQLPMNLPHMKGPVVTSLIFHGLVILFAIVGMPYLKPEVPVIDNPIAVEFVDAPESTVTKEELDKPIDPPKPEPDKPQPPPKKAMPKVTAKTPPKPQAPMMPEDVVAPPENIEKPQENPEKVKNPPKKPAKKPVLTKPQEEPNEEEFKGLLRNLMDAKPQPEAEEVDPKSKEPTLTSRFSQSMSRGELSALTRQLGQCWNVMAGARYAEDLVVKLKIFVNPDRTVRDVQVVERMRYNTDSFYKAAADTAVRAVFRCSPLDLPPDKYNLWNVINIDFDPRKML